MKRICKYVTLNSEEGPDHVDPDPRDSVIYNNYENLEQHPILQIQGQTT